MPSVIASGNRRHIQALSVPNILDSLYGLALESRGEAVGGAAAISLLGRAGMRGMERVELS
jgi:hypothetical protein